MDQVEEELGKPNTNDPTDRLTRRMPREIVTIIVDPAFGYGLRALPDASPVWIADTATNRPAAEQLWQEHPNRTHRNGITTFVIDPSAAPDQWCVSILDDVDLHHGLSGDGRSSLRVIGCQLSTQIVERLRDLGLTLVEELADGFIATGSGP